MRQKTVCFIILLMIFFSNAFAEEDLNKALLDAAKKGKIDLVKNLLIKGADINAKSKSEGITPLMATMFKCNPDVSKLLIQKGADVNLKDKEGGTALTAAVFFGCQKGVALLLEKDADLNCRCRSSYVLSFIDSDEEYLTPLILASIKGYSKIAKMLLIKGAKVDDKTELQNTALKYAVSYDQLEIVKILIKNKANIHDKYEKGTTLLMKTINGNKNNLSIAKLLIEKGIKVDEKDKYGGTAFMYAAAYGNYIDLLKLLLKNGADVNSVAKGGYTALLGATGLGIVEVVKFLIDNGADINAKNEQGKTALMIVEEHKKLKIVELLKKAAAKK